MTWEGADRIEGMNQYRARCATPKCPCRGAPVGVTERQRGTSIGFGNSSVEHFVTDDVDHGFVLLVPI